MSSHGISRERLPDGAAVGADGACETTAQAPIASAGFGSPGLDPTVKRIDLNDALIRHPQATFVMRAAGHAMAGAGIGDGDVLLVDRAIAAMHGHVVIAAVDGELICRRLNRQAGCVSLDTADALPQRLVCSEERPLEVWGVVTTVIKALTV